MCRLRLIHGSQMHRLIVVHIVAIRLRGEGERGLPRGQQARLLIGIHGREGGTVAGRSECCSTAAFADIGVDIAAFALDFALVRWTRVERGALALRAMRGAPRKVVGCETGGLVCTVEDINPRETKGRMLNKIRYRLHQTGSGTHHQDEEAPVERAEAATRCS